MIELLIWSFFAYLIGSLSSAIIVCRSMGLADPRENGSKNPGATNVLRMGNKKAALFTLIGDLLKGFLFILIAHLFGYFAPHHLLVLTIAIVLGHIYPIFFNFKGGKGVATYYGALFAWNLFFPATAIASALTWLIIAKFFKISSLSAIIAIFLTPFYAWLFGNNLKTIVLLSILSIIIIWQHRSNIQRLLSKEEKLDSKIS